jgi:hypothetical protein
MTASYILLRAEAAGLKLRMHNGKVRVSGKGPRPEHLLAELQKYREDIAHLLTLRERLQSAQSSPGLRTTPPSNLQRSQNRWQRNSLTPPTSENSAVPDTSCSIRQNKKRSNELEKFVPVLDVPDAPDDVRRSRAHDKDSPPAPETPQPENEIDELW